MSENSILPIIEEKQEPPPPSSSSSNVALLPPSTLGLSIDLENLVKTEFLIARASPVSSTKPTGGIISSTAEAERWIESLSEDDRIRVYEGIEALLFGSLSLAAKQAFDADVAKNLILNNNDHAKKISSPSIHPIMNEKAQEESCSSSKTLDVHSSTPTITTHDNKQHRNLDSSSRARQRGDCDGEKNVSRRREKRGNNLSGNRREKDATVAPGVGDKARKLVPQHNMNHRDRRRLGSPNRNNRFSSQRDHQGGHDARGLFPSSPYEPSYRGHPIPFPQNQNAFPSYDTHHHNMNYYGRGSPFRVADLPSDYDRRASQPDRDRERGRNRSGGRHFGHSNPNGGADQDIGRDQNDLSRNRQDVTSDNKYGKSTTSGLTHVRNDPSGDDNIVRTNFDHDSPSSHRDPSNDDSETLKLDYDDDPRHISRSSVCYGVSPHQKRANLCLPYQREDDRIPERDSSHQDLKKNRGDNASNHSQRPSSQPYQRSDILPYDSFHRDDSHRTPSRSRSSSRKRYSRRSNSSERDRRDKNQSNRLDLECDEGGEKDRRGGKEFYSQNRNCTSIDDRNVGGNDDTQYSTKPKDLMIRSRKSSRHKRHRSRRSRSRTRSPSRSPESDESRHRRASRRRRRDQSESFSYSSNDDGSNRRNRKYHRSRKRRHRSRSYSTDETHSKKRSKKKRKDRRKGDSEKRES